VPDRPPPLLDVLPPAQRRLWDEMAEVPGHFTLYGGTAIALWLGHRQSVDFDFFGRESFDPDALLTLRLLEGAEVLQRERDTLTCLVDRGGPVQLSFFGVPSQRRLEAPGVWGGVRVASLLDLAGTKIWVLQKRAESRDYLDVAALLDHGIPLERMLAAGRALYGHVFNPLIALKALSYFDDGDLRSLPEPVKHRLREATSAVDVAALPALEATR
jgi:hypothetical protein